MSACVLLHLPDDVLLCILRFCRAQDLAALSSTCHHFHCLIADELLWKHLCCRDFRISQQGLGPVDSYRKLYSNLLYKYGSMLGVYQSQIGPCGGLLEIRYKDGILEGVQWEPSSEENVMAPLKESIVFTINGDKVPTECLCIPHIHPHPCTFKIDKSRGILTQHCSNSETHLQAIWSDSGFDAVGGFELGPRKLQLIYLNEVIGNGLVHRPLILPTPSEIPVSLRAKDGSIPNQIITPGLFQGTYGSHGLEIILFRYKDENEIHGYKVTGDANVYASKVTVKILLKYPVRPSEEEQRSLAALKSIEPTMSDIPVCQIAEHSFKPPDAIHRDTNTRLPSKSKARYHGFGQIANVWFQRHKFTPVQVVVFDNDLLGVMWLELQSFSLYSRIKKKFTSNILDAYRSAV